MQNYTYINIMTAIYIGAGVDIRPIPIVKIHKKFLLY